MKIGIIIQARMGSTRLPGKVLKLIADKPIVEHVYLRTLESKKSHITIVATSDTVENDILAEYLIAKNIPCYRGSENLVANRFFDVSKIYDLDIIVRITSDNPLFDYESIDQLIDFMIENDYEYVTKTHIAYGANVEVFRSTSLEKTLVNSNNLADLEHVTRYILNHPQDFRIGYIKSDIDYSEFRITVDTQSDFELITSVYNHLYNRSPIRTCEAINFIKSNLRKVILGTAQLGLDYGINNETGFSVENSIEILKVSEVSGVHLFDTASVYGESETIIGKYFESSIGDNIIITKFIDDRNPLEEKLNDSLTKLSVESVEYYFFHRFSDLVENKNLLNSLKKLKECNKIKKIGISIYEPSELKVILSDYSDIIDAIQIPMNIIDTRWYKYFSRLKKSNIEIHIRSIFLQGILFKSIKELESIGYLRFIPIIREINELASDYNLTIYELLLFVVYFNPEIDYIVVGLDNKKQVCELRDTITRLYDINIDFRDLYVRICRLFKCVDEIILNPSRWQKEI